MNCTFPTIISELRRKKGISQKQAAKDLGVSQALLSHYEKGIRECGLDFLLKLSDYYSISCDELLGKTSAPKPSSDETAACLIRIINDAQRLLGGLK